VSGDRLPVVEGFTVERDRSTGEWVATSSSGAFAIRGRSQAELDAARRELYVREMTAFRQVLAEVFPPGRWIS
jgi:hypothetical protein